MCGRGSEKQGRHVELYRKEERNKVDGVPKKDIKERRERIVKFKEW